MSYIYIYIYIYIYDISSIRVKGKPISQFFFYFLNFILMYTNTRGARRSAVG